MKKLVEIMIMVAAFALSCSSNEMRVRSAKLTIPPWSGCGGWCAKVVIIRNGKIDCSSKSAPSNCETDGFSAGTELVASFDNDCTALDADADDDSIKFRLYTPVGGSHSDWCIEKVKIEASNGTKTKTYETWRPWNEEGYEWVGQGDWAREHWAKNYEYVYKSSKILDPNCC